MTRSYDAVVLAGGAARRLGGADKPALPVGGRTLLDRVLAACAGADRTVVVGPRRPTARPVRWAGEEPPGGGPLPALAAGLTALASAAPTAGVLASAAPASGGATSGERVVGAPACAVRGLPEVVLVLAADLPFLTAETAHRLAGVLSADPYPVRTGAAEAAERREKDPTEWEGVVLTDAGGRDQPLAAAYRIEPLRRGLALLGAEHGGLAGLPLRLLTAELVLRRIADPTGEAAFDCDTWEDVAVARARLDAAARG
ncbi:molybdenum cofactor guanylyltransferase [Actinacidiphila sp. ITFR-21]|uniref:molybdenum cofactor guanylyltransferase n=1 Tax=Actinacidiphila sp. ITFR-21 TaxID=3075199 RepID=UPI0037D996D1